MSEENKEEIKVETNTGNNEKDISKPVIEPVNIVDESDKKPLKKGLRDVVKLNCTYCKIEKLCERFGNAGKVKCLNCGKIFKEGSN